MQCVILAAGKGTRLHPLTQDTPKPLVKVGGKAILDRIVESLPSSVDELIIVTGYLEDKIKEHCGEEFMGRSVTYIHQSEQKGTAHALWLCKDFLKNRFLFMFADDIHGSDDLARVTSYSRAISTCATDTPERFGIVVCNSDGTLLQIEEKPSHPSSNLASTGLMVLDTNIFDFPVTDPKNGEYYLTDAIAAYSAKYPMAVVEQKLWIPIAYPEDIKKAEDVLISLH